LTPVGARLDPIAARVARWVYANRAHAFVVERQTVQIEAWAPRLAECHANAAEFCDRMEGASVVPGWLIAPYGMGFYQFFLHSVVRTAGGDLTDITPVDALITWTYAFLQHDETVASSADLIAARCYAALSFQA
jgi:hypothetical protein